MSLNNALLATVSRFGPEDILLLVVVFILLIEGQCDKKFIIFFLLIFLIELPKGLLAK